MTIQSGVVSGNQAGYGEWNLNQGSGTRSADVYVTFPQEFSVPPKLVLGLVHLRTPEDKSTYVTLNAKNITKVGFNLEFQTSGDSIIHSVSGSWLAYTQ
jgi:hypothetical protein